MTNFRAEIQKSLLKKTASEIRRLMDLIQKRCHFCRNQHLQQGCRVSNASRDRDECFSNKRMLLRQIVKTVTYLVELLNFVQDRTRMHRVRSFPENLRSEHFRVG
jgi:hypothetical protein